MQAAIVANEALVAAMKDSKLTRGFSRSQSDRSLILSGSDSAEDIASLKQTSFLRWLQYTLHLNLEEPSASLPGFAFALLSVAVILLNAVVGVVQTLVNLRDVDQGTWFALEAGCVAWFTMEYLLRFSVTPRRLRFVLEPLNIVDLVAILPFYAELFSPIDSSQTSILRLLRLLRAFRLLKISRHSKKIMVLFEAMAASWGVLILMLYLFIIVMILSSTLMYFSERGEYSEEEDTWFAHGRKTHFENIPAGFYWSMITMATVGFGDHVVGDHSSVNWTGQFISASFTIVGIVMISMPISIISMNFNLGWRRVLSETSSNVVFEQAAGVHEDAAGSLLNQSTPTVASNDTFHMVGNSLDPVIEFLNLAQKSQGSSGSLSGASGAQNQSPGLMPTLSEQDAHLESSANHQSSQPEGGAGQNGAGTPTSSSNKGNPSRSLSPNTASNRLFGAFRTRMATNSFVTSFSSAAKSSESRMRVLASKLGQASQAKLHVDPSTNPTRNQDLKLLISCLKSNHDDISDSMVKCLEIQEEVGRLAEEAATLQADIVFLLLLQDLCLDGTDVNRTAWMETIFNTTMKRSVNAKRINTLFTSQRISRVFRSNAQRQRREEPNSEDGGQPVVSPLAAAFSPALQEGMMAIYQASLQKQSSSAAEEHGQEKASSQNCESAAGNLASSTNEQQQKQAEVVQAPSSLPPSAQEDVSEHPIQDSREAILEQASPKSDVQLESEDEGQQD